MKKLSLLLAVALLAVSLFVPVYGQESATDAMNQAYLTFVNDAEEVSGGILTWDEDTQEWEADFPSIFGSIVMKGTYSEDGTMEVVEDGTGGYAFAYLPPIQEVFSDALNGTFQTGSIAQVLPDNELSLAVEACEDIVDQWKPTIADIAKQYNPEEWNHDTIFYGASNFAFWKTMEEDLAPYSVQNHAFGGSTDQDLYNWAPYMLYPYNPKCVFFQTGSNDYVQSEAETDAEKVAEAMEFKKKMFAEFHEKMPDAIFVVMNGILLPGREEYVDMTLDINDQLRAFCKETDYMYFIDAESLTFNRDTMSFVDGVEDLFNDDQIHLTDESRIVWANNWMLPFMEEMGLPVNEQVGE